MRVNCNLDAEYCEHECVSSLPSQDAGSFHGHGRRRPRFRCPSRAADGTVQLCEVRVGGGTAAACSAETLGLTVAAGKEPLAGLQHHLVQAQTEEHCRSRRRGLRWARRAR